jgi:hypothetical protein
MEWEGFLPISHATRRLGLDGSLFPYFHSDNAAHGHHWRSYDRLNNNCRGMLDFFYCLTWLIVFRRASTPTNHKNNCCWVISFYFFLQTLAVINNWMHDLCAVHLYWIKLIKGVEIGKSYRNATRRLDLAKGLFS